MNEAMALFVAGAAVVSAGAGGAAASVVLAERVGGVRRKERSIRHQTELSVKDEGSSFEDRRERSRPRDESIGERLLAYAENVGSRLSYGATKAVSPRVRSGKADSDSAAAFLEDHGARAGRGDRLTVRGFVETRMRLEIALTAVGFAVGFALTAELAFLLGFVGFVVGRRALYAAVLALERERADEAERYISEMLEVVALGLRSGLTFDRSFSLYGSHFATGFAAECASACRSWTLGLMTREEALRGLSASYRCEELERAVEGAIRSTRFGSSFSSELEELARQSRANYKSSVRERVAKAPVKMMLPTGALILPAMLLLVMGPILLELMGGF